MPSKEVRQKRISSGLCVQCNNKPELGKTFCLKCLNAHNLRSIKIREKNIANGKCECGKDKPVNEYRCPKCKEKHRLQTKDLKSRRKENGLCTMCGKKLIERTDVTKCINCMENTFGFNWE